MKIFKVLSLFLFISSLLVASPDPSFTTQNSTQDSKISDLLSALSTNKKTLEVPKPKYDPLLVAVIMVKNEATVMKATLQPYADAGVKHFVVLDTGSTDDTIATTKAFFEENQITHGVIREEPFIDFSASRNRALNIVRETFPNACFMVMADAEWILQNPQGLVQFCEKHKYDKEDAHDMRILNWSNLDYPNPRLIRCKSGAHFSQPVHEYLAVKSLGESVPNDIYFAWNSTKLGQEKSQERWKRDLVLLLNEHQKDPDNERTVFYLAQTYDCLGDTDNAAIYYQKRAEMGRWYEEAFQAQYRLGNVYARCNQWDKAIFTYLAAFSMSPHRAEPLIKIANYYVNKDNFSTGFLFASKAAEIAYPVNDKLFVERKSYEYERYELLTRAAWYIKEYEIGEKAAELAILGSDEWQYETAKKNLAYYINRKK